ncbi:MAG: extracellular solute-binding protein, partial [Planctomycetota bacterium]|nr:extracellular solute-binding protein [Planctomycetota bacterium]
GQGVPEHTAIEQITLLQTAPEVGHAAPRLQAPGGEARPVAPRRGRRIALAALGVAAVALVGLAAFRFWPSRAHTPPSVRLGIAHGTEKDAWLAWAVEEFAKTPGGRGVTVELLPMGSQRGARAILSGDRRIHVWFPASSVYEGQFKAQWLAAYHTKPVLKQEDIALTPMVFIVWQECYEALRDKYKALTFATLKTALQEKDGWETIAGKAEWGKFLFGLADPEDSNCGLVNLLLMAQEFHKKEQALTLADVNKEDFQTWLHAIKATATPARDSASMMREMTVKGPARYDVVCTYECLAIRYLKNAEDRWESLHVEYPTVNLWNDNTYYVLNVPWGTPDTRRAAEAFMKFLLSEQAQKKALTFGFRPANPDVPMRFPESPFELYAKYGLKLDVPVVCETPKDEVLDALLTTWKKGPHSAPILLDEP